jgi:hypothetical protein
LVKKDAKGNKTDTSKPTNQSRKNKTQYKNQKEIKWEIMS